VGDETNGISFEMFERFHDGNGHMGNESLFNNSISRAESMIRLWKKTLIYSFLL